MQLSRWKQVSLGDVPAGLLKRAGCASVASAAHIVIFGGRRDAKYFCDAWSFDPRSGSLRCLNAGGEATPRVYHTATLLGDIVWVLGGACAGVGQAGDVCRDAAWCFNLKTREWREPRLK